MQSKQTDRCRPEEVQLETSPPITGPPRQPLESRLAFDGRIDAFLVRWTALRYQFVSKVRRISSRLPAKRQGPILVGGLPTSREPIGIQDRNLARFPARG